MQKVRKTRLMRDNAAIFPLLRRFRRYSRLCCKHLKLCAAHIREGRQDDALIEAMRAVAMARWADKASRMAQKEVE